MIEDLLSYCAVNYEMEYSADEGYSTLLLEIHCQNFSRGRNTALHTELGSQCQNTQYIIQVKI